MGQMQASRDFLDKLGEMHTAERELSFALPLIRAAAKSDDLKTLLDIHLDETRGHVTALDEIARHLDRELPMKHCAAMTKLIAKGVRVIARRMVSSEQDAALIAVGREIEQFEMASYETLCAAAKSEGFAHEVAVLTSILNQEQMADELLGELGAGRGPLKDVVEHAVLRRIGARRAA